MSQCFTRGMGSQAVYFLCMREHGYTKYIKSRPGLFTVVSPPPLPRSYLEACCHTRIIWRLTTLHMTCEQLLLCWPWRSSPHSSTENSFMHVYATVCTCNCVVFYEIWLYKSGDHEDFSLPCVTTYILVQSSWALEEFWYDFPNLTMETALSTETFLPVYQTSWHHIKMTVILIVLTQHLTLQIQASCHCEIKHSTQICVSPGIYTLEIATAVHFNLSEHLQITTRKTLEIFVPLFFSSSRWFLPSDGCLAILIA